MAVWLIAFGDKKKKDETHNNEGTDPEHKVVYQIKHTTFFLSLNSKKQNIGAVVFADPQFWFLHICNHKDLICRFCLQKL